MIIAALLLLIVVVLLVIAAVFGGGGNTTVDLGVGTFEASAAEFFFIGAGTLLLLVISLGLFRSSARRASKRRAERKRVGELSQQLDEYRRDERETTDEDQH